MIDANEIREFLKFLDPHAKHFMFMFMDIDSIRPQMGNIFCLVDEAIAMLEEFERQGNPATLHVTLNKTNHSGRKRKDITGCRVLCLDIDTPISVANLNGLVDGFHPGYVVESSPGKYHLYWKLEDGLPLELWSKYELALARKFGGDRNLKDITKTIRVPGVSRRTKSGETFLPRKVGGSTPRAFNLEDLQQMFPWMETEFELAEKEKKKEGGTFNSGLDKRLKGDKSVVLDPTNRNESLYDACFAESCRVLKANKNWLKEKTETEVVELVQVPVQLISEEVNSGFELSPKGALGEEEVEKTFRSATEKAVHRMIEEYEKGSLNGSNGSGYVNGGIVPIKDGSGSAESAETVFEYNLKVEPLSESAISTLSTVQRVIQRFGSSFLRVDGLVYAFDGHDCIWRPQKGELAVISDYVRRCCADILKDPRFLASCMGKNGLSESKYAAGGARVLGAPFMGGVKAELIESNDIRRVKIDLFDSKPELLFCGGEVLDLNTLEVREPEPEDLLLGATPVKWNRNARCTGWLKFIGELFEYNDDCTAMVGFLQEIFGYSLTGSVDAQLIFIHFGGGCNGKSKVLNALGALMGEYCTLMDCGALAKSKNAAQSEFTRVAAQAEGKRVVIVDDLDTRTKWSEGAIKSLTSRKVAARRLYGEKRDIPNRAKFHIGCNEKPEPESENEGLIRRMCIIPYPRQFKASTAKESAISDMIESEISGILKWAVEGFRRFKARGGFDMPAEVRLAIEEYREENFSVETALRALFEKPLDPKDPLGVWLSTEDILSAVNERLTTAKQLDTASIGKDVNRVFKPIKIRAAVGGVRTVKYWLIVKPQQEEETEKDPMLTRIEAE